MGSSSNKSPRVLLLPALGTNAYLYAPLLAALNAGSMAAATREPGDVDSKNAESDPAESAAASWRPPGGIVALRYAASKPGETLSEYARRQFREQFSQAQAGPVAFDLVIGASFGGMVAQELIAGGLIVCERLVLISTCFSGRDLTWPLRFVAPLFRLLPWIPGPLKHLLLYVVAGLFPIVRRGIPDPAGFTAMTRAANVDFLFASGTMIAEWRADIKPAPIAEGLAPRTLQIHGERDPVLSFRKIQRQRAPEVAISKGDHIMILTRAPELARRIAVAGYWL